MVSGIINPAGWLLYHVIKTIKSSWFEKCRIALLLRYWWVEITCGSSFNLSRADILNMLSRDPADISSP